MIAGGAYVRVGRVLTALGLLVGAAVAHHELGEGGLERLLSALVARMPAEDLILEVLVRGPNASTAEAVVRRSAGLGAGVTRTLASGAMLDAMLAALRRFEADGRGTMEGAVGSLGFLPGTLDDTERTRLAELDADEILASDGEKTDLYALAQASTRLLAPGRAMAGAVDARGIVAARLAASEKGRALLLPRPTVARAESGDEIVIELSSLLDDAAAPTTRFGVQSDEVVVHERAEFRPADPSLPTVELVESDADSGSSPFGPPAIRLLADAAPGKGTIVLRGLAVPRSKLPEGSGSGAARIAIERARAIAGAREYERSVETVVAPSEPDAFEWITDPDAVEAVREDLARSTVASRGGGASRRVPIRRRAVRARLRGGGTRSDPSLSRG